MVLDYNKIRELKESNTIGVLKSNKNNFLLSLSEAHEVVERTRIAKNLESNEHSMLLITYIAQNGGANASALQESKVSLNNVTLTANELSEHLNVVKPGATLRQLCRALSTDIAAIAEIFAIPGDLASQFESENPNPTVKELAWASHFQLQTNNTPLRVQKFLYTRRTSLNEKRNPTT